MSRFQVVLESLLAVEELEQQTLQAQGESPAAYEEFVQSTEETAIQERKEEESEEVASDSDGVSDGSEDDAGDDPDIIDDKDALIELKDDDITVESINGSSNFITASVGDIMIGLSYLGVKYTPVLASMMFKGTLWMFSRLGTLIAKTIRGINKYIERSSNSRAALASRLEACRTALAKMAEDGAKRPEGTYRNTRVITRLKTGKSTAFEYNIRQASVALREIVSSLVKESEKGYRLVEELASADPSKAPKSINSIMEVKPDSAELIKGTLKEYLDQSGNVVQYRSKAVLPGDAVFLLNAPQVDNRDMEGIAESYRAASAFLAVDPDSIRLIDQVQYLSTHDLVRLTAATAQLLELSDHLVTSLHRLKGLQPSLAYSVKKLFLRLADEEAKTRLSYSFIEPMYLRSSFASGTLLSAVMELNTYASRVAAASIQLTEEHIRKMG